MSIGDTDSGVDDPEDDEQRRRRALVLFVDLFVLVLPTGGAIAFGVVSFGDTGELTVLVTDQNGNAASGQEVQVVDPEPGK